MSARRLIWWLLPLSPLGIVLMLVGDGAWDAAGFILAAMPLAVAAYAAWRNARRASLVAGGAAATAAHGR